MFIFSLIQCIWAPNFEYVLLRYQIGQKILLRPHFPSLYVENSGINSGYVFDKIIFERTTWSLSWKITLSLNVLKLETWFMRGGPVVEKHSFLLYLNVFQSNPSLLIPIPPDLRNKV